MFSTRMVQYFMSQSVLHPAQWKYDFLNYHDCLLPAILSQLTQFLLLLLYYQQEVNQQPRTRIPGYQDTVYRCVNCWSNEWMYSNDRIDYAVQVRKMDPVRSSSLCQRCRHVDKDWEIKTIETFTVHFAPICICMTDWKILHSYMFRGLRWRHRNKLRPPPTQKPHQTVN